MLRKSAFAAAVIAATASAPVSAAVSICLGGGCSAQPGSNVLVVAGAPANTVIGTLNNAPGTVTFSSTEQLVGLANGQARVAAADGVLNNPLIFSITSGIITALEFNIDALTKGKVTFTFSGGNSNGQVTQAYDLDRNGNNFFNAFNGTFSSVTMNFSEGATVADVAQFRINSAPAIAAVPEPTTWTLMLLGFGGIGFAMRRRKQDRARLVIAKKICL